MKFAACSIAVVLFLLEIPLLPRAFSNAGEARLLMYALPQGVILAVLIGLPLGAFLGVGGRSIHHDVHLTASGSEPGRSRIRITSG